MNSYDQTKEWARSVGNDAWWLRKFGATDQQIKNYVDFKAASVKQHAQMTDDNKLVNFYYKVARSNFKENKKSRMALETIEQTVTQGWHILNWR